MPGGPVVDDAGAQLPDPGGRQAASRIMERNVGQQPLPGWKIVFATAGRQPRPQRLLIAEAHHRLAHPVLERLALMNYARSLRTRQQRPQVAKRRLPDVAAVQQTAHLGDVARDARAQPVAVGLEPFAQQLAQARDLNPDAAGATRVPIQTTDWTWPRACRASRPSIGAGNAHPAPDGCTDAIARVGVSDGARAKA